MPNSNNVLIGAGLGAMVFSLLIGLASPVHFRIVIFRAVIAGIAVAGLFWVLQWVLRRLFPELFSPIVDTGKSETVTAEAKTENSRSSADEGGHLNIVLEGDEAEEPLVEELEESGEEDLISTDGSESDDYKESSAELGSISQFSDFSGGEKMPEKVHLSKSSQSTGSGKMNLGSDPKEIAQALQTMMKRDE